MAGTIRLSGKEVSGLAARVLASALMPAGAIGSASEAVEFLELAGQDGLAGLDREKDELLGAEWKAPDIIEEGAGFAVCEGGASPAAYYFAALADWLSVMAAASGSGVIVLRHGTFRRYLHVIPYLLARRELCGLALERGRGAVEVSWARADGNGWRYCGPRPVAPGAVHLPEGLPRQAREGGTTVLLASRRGGADIGLDAFSGSGHVLSSSGLAAMKADILARGWPVDPPLWASLMAFADRSLIKTSEQSRLGAG